MERKKANEGKEQRCLVWLGGTHDPGTKIRKTMWKTISHRDVRSQTKTVVNSTQ